MSPSRASVEALHEATAIYTRDEVVESLLEALDWPCGEKRLLEPSCGDGAFLLTALESCLDRGIDPVDVLVGYEVHEGAASAARGRVVQRLREEGWDEERCRLAGFSIVRTLDFLTQGPMEHSYDFVVGNPPYLRWLSVPKDMQEEYLTVVPEIAQADLLHAFLERCTRVLKPGGKLSFVTADRWLFNEGAALLREEIGKRFGLHEVRRLDAKTAFYRPKRRDAGTPARVHPVVVVLREGASALTRSPVYPGATEDASSLTLDDVAVVRLAPWLGKDGIFTVDAATALKLPPATTVRAVDTEDIRLNVLSPERRFAIRTKPDEEPHPTVLAHLDRLLPGMAARGRRTPRWLPPETWHNWDLSVESLVVPRITKRLRCVRLPPDVLPVNHSLSVVSAGSMGLDAIQRVIESDAAQAWIEARAPRLEGGYLSITTRLLRKLPIPETTA